MEHLERHQAPRFASIISQAQSSISDPWIKILDERQLKELEFAEVYERDFHHGTIGHNQLMLIATLAKFITFVFDYYQLIEKD